MGIGNFLKKMSGIQAYQDRKKAKSTKVEADELLAYLQEENEKRRSKSNEILDKFARVRLEALKETIGPFLHFLDFMGQNYKDKEYEIYSQIDIKPEKIQELKTLDMNAGTALGTVAASGSLALAALSGVPSAVTWGVSTFAAASTGTAISSLSGAAAWNATLAWLGGGSLAAGGGGMAAGAAVLTGITWASTGLVALASAGLIASAYYSKKYTQAVTYLEEVKEYKAKLELGWQLMNNINQRALELQNLTLQLKDHIVTALQYLEPLVYDFQTDDEYQVLTFQQAALLVKGMSDIAQVSLMDSDGNLNDNTLIVANNTKKILNRNL